MRQGLSAHGDVGNRVGVVVGVKDGWLLGCRVGGCVGALLGLVDGDAVGCATGDTEGIPVGTDDGASVHALHVAGHVVFTVAIHPSCPTMSRHGLGSASIPGQTAVG